MTIPTPISNTSYWHRSLNQKKLIEVGFCQLPPNRSLAQYLKLHKLPNKPEIPGMREMEKKDVERVHEMINKYH